MVIIMIMMVILVGGWWLIAYGCCCYVGLRLEVSPFFAEGFYGEV